MKGVTIISAILELIICLADMICHDGYITGISIIFPMIIAIIALTAIITEGIEGTDNDD